ncbi:MAG: GGDEF domain-containing protein [Burkholderiales bacterium]
MNDQNIPFDLVLEALDDQIALIDRSGTILYVNRAWIEFGKKNGASRKEWTGANYLAPLDIADTASSDTAKGIRNVLDGNLPDFSREYPCHSPKEKRWFMMRIAPVGSKNLFVVSHHNITQRRLHEEKIRKISLQDPLTGLLNRRAFDDRLEQAFRHAVRQTGEPLSLLLIDLDNFKAINDELGHQAGDNHLVGTAKTISGIIREGVDLAFRFGGDEFAVMIFADHRIAREKAHQILDNMEGKVSIGVATIDGSSTHDIDQEAFFRRADEALYEAKRQGRGRVQSSHHQ